MIPDESVRAKLGSRVVDVLARLHTVDPDAIGLGDLGRKEAYLDRQLKRWRTQWENSKTRELDAMAGRLFERASEQIQSLDSIVD